MSEADTSSEPARGGAHLLKFQIGPVQDFIAAARSTRDLWSGSYLLSWLVAAGIRKLPATATLIYPARDSEAGVQPLLKPKLNPDDDGILIPNLPNIFIARIEGDAVEAAKGVKEMIQKEWQAIADAVWEKRAEIGIPMDQKKDRFQAQVARHLSIAWQITPVDGDSPETYREAYRQNGWRLDAVRQTRDFAAWDSSTGMPEKDSLTGKEEALVGGKDFQSAREKAGGEYGSLFKKHADHLGALAIIKRCWHLAYLRDIVTEGKPKLQTSSGDFRIRSIPAIAARKKTHDDDDETGETGGGDKYIAAIAFDGDSIGAWVNGDKSPSKTDLRSHHSKFSRDLSNFALGKVREIVEEMVDGTDENKKPCKVPLGQLIYAGGDDVVALVPADAALEVCKQLQETFCECTRDTPTLDEQPDASAGIAIAHIHAPLQDLIREAQRAEKRAKNIVGRPAFSVTLMKRSGEISHWGSKWSSGGWELYQKVDELLSRGDLGGRFPHRVCQLLERHLTTRTGISKQTDAITDDSTIKELISLEFLFTAERQGSKQAAKDLEKPLETYLNGVLAARDEGEKKGPQSKVTSTQELLESVLCLCATVAFANRNRESTSSSPATAKPQSVA
ncbi:MAG: type III-B CRISPR-associated protein Cas10/Cmr2 [Verrucomicrobiae bacterium]|nr:type III-B CRISPR-associated protein Cas10/Cmr2 [Verrucomicrobiae bacterium]MCP5538602.1 type III-B CRISPR-associated protein Cas10/Cmr2 [Akkermansiaceae bacterium]